MAIRVPSFKKTHHAYGVRQSAASSARGLPAPVTRRAERVASSQKDPLSAGPLHQSPSHAECSSGSGYAHLTLASAQGSRHETIPDEENAEAAPFLESHNACGGARPQTELSDTRNFSVRYPRFFALLRLVHLDSALGLVDSPTRAREHTQQHASSIRFRASSAQCENATTPGCGACAQAAIVSGAFMVGFVTALHMHQC